MRLFGLLVAAVALAWPTVAAAKSWITVSAPSGGVEARERWNATLKFPLDPNATVPRRPELVFTHDNSDVRRRFRAGPTGKRGVFRAGVTLPRAGTWTVYVYAYEIGAVAPHPSSRQILVKPAGSDG
jgi:hypothetical protein